MSNKDIWVNLAELYLQHGHLDASEAAADKYQTVSKEDFKSWDARMRTFLAKGLLQKALDSAEYAMDSAHGEAYYHVLDSAAAYVSMMLNDIMHGDEDRDYDLKILQFALFVCTRHNFLSDEIHYLDAVVREWFENFESALQRYRQKAEWCEEAGRCLYKLGRFKEAVETLNGCPELTRDGVRCLKKCRMHLGLLSDEESPTMEDDEKSSADVVLLFKTNRISEASRLLQKLSNRLTDVDYRILARQCNNLVNQKALKSSLSEVASPEAKAVLYNISRE